MTGRSRTALILVAILSLVAIGEARAGEDPGQAWDETLADLDLEALMEIPVTSVAGVARPLRDTPAAIYVITEEDIRRGGHRTLVDALRMVPGVNVAQIDSNIWAISVRGFNDRFSTKLLVLVDGRAVYNSLFSGVFWDALDTVLADIDRIEIIRGPGATLWGANAVNGVINIVTKKARKTRGLYATAGAGDHEKAFGTIRYGGRIGEDTYFRAYAKYFDRDGFEFSSGDAAGDEWDMTRVGFRFDFESNPDTTLTVQGDFYDGTEGAPIVTQSLASPFTERRRVEVGVQGWNLLARVENLKSAEAGWTLQAYLDRAERDRTDFFDDRRDTLDVEFRHHFTAGESHSLIWGLGYRYRPDETDGTLTLSFDPEDENLTKFSAFVQDTIELADDRLSLMIGSKFEHNDFTGFEVQPGVRLAWRPDQRRTAWASFARAVRTPSRASSDLVLTTRIVTPPPTGVPTPVRVLGNSSLDSEELHAYELGYRFRPINRLTVDITGFYNDYDKLITIGEPTASPFDVMFSNGTEGESHGLEISGRWDIAERVRVTGAYSYLDISLEGLDESDEGTSPEHQISLRSYANLTHDLELNAAAYYVDRLPAMDVSSYTRVDVGLIWRPTSNVELAVWGQNLLESSHPEFIDSFFVIDPVEVERSVYGRATISF